MTVTAPPDTKNGVLQPGQRFGFTGNVWVATFGPYNRPRLFSRMVIVPPSAALVTTQLVIFNEVHRLANAPTGIATGFTPVRMIPIVSGTATFVVWNVGTGNAPEATLFMEQDQY